MVVLLMSARAESAEFKSSLGIGIQFGGVIGWQGSIRAGNSIFRVALGAVGLSAGYDHFVTDSVSLGVQGFIIGLGGGVGINANYYFAQPDVSGWIVGLDVHGCRCLWQSNGDRGLSLHRIPDFFRSVSPTRAGRCDTWAWLELGAVADAGLGTPTDLCWHRCLGAGSVPAGRRRALRPLLRCRLPKGRSLQSRACSSSRSTQIPNPD